MACELEPLIDRRGLHARRKTTKYWARCWRTGTTFSTHGLAAHWRKPDRTQVRLVVRLLAPLELRALLVLQAYGCVGLTTTKQLRNNSASGPLSRHYGQNHRSQQTGVRGSIAWQPCVTAHDGW